MKLSKNDYISILNYYNINSANMTPLQIKNKAEKILADKLCKCIKKVDPTLTKESKAIAICADSVLRKKNLKIFRFTCKKKIQLVKGASGLKLVKTKKTLRLKRK